MKPTPNRPPDLEAAPLLAFGAHPDDIEFGCGGIVAVGTAAGRGAHFVVCSRGESATHGTPHERWKEAARASKLLGASLELLELDGDAHLEECVAHVIRLAGVIRRLRPGIILAPTVNENQHPDHFRLGRLVRDAARLARYGGVPELRAEAPHAVGVLLYYAITSEAEPAAGQPILIDVSAPGVLAAWKGSMEAHATQGKTRSYVELQLARARVWGLRAGVDHAQPLWPNDALVFSSLSALSASARRF